MSLFRQIILGIPVTSDTKENILEYIKKYLFSTPRLPQKNAQISPKPLSIVTPNPEQIMLGRSDERFAEMLKQADVALPDGIGLLWASRLLPGSRIRRRIPGIEFMEDLVRMAVERGVSIGLIGGRSGIAVSALECLQARYTNLIGWATDAPEFSLAKGNLHMSGKSRKETETYFKQLSGRIVQSGTRMLFVGLGAPKQEYFIELLSRELSLRSGVEPGKQSRRVRHIFQVRDDGIPVVLMSVGGSFDMIAGRLKRAPLFIRSIGFEWFWRLLQEPWRWQRQTALAKFFVAILHAKVSGQN